MMCLLLPWVDMTEEWSNVTFLFTTNSAVSISATANPASHRYKHVAKQNTNRTVASKLHREEESSPLDAMTLPFGRQDSCSGTLLLSFSISIGSILLSGNVRSLGGYCINFDQVR